VFTIIPPHFTTISFACRDQEHVLDWIYENLEGRFYLDNDRSREQPDTFLLLDADQMIVGFELNKEAVIFGLQIDVITR